MSYKDHDGRRTRSHSIASRYSGSSRLPPPEIILNLSKIIVLYKPPYWKCELPSLGEDELEQCEDERTRAAESCILLRWIRQHVSDIDEALYKEDFNPAQSGTGFGPLAHRIDRETSGPLLVSKSASSQRHLKKQFHKREVSKRYLCLVHGKMKEISGTILAKIRTIRTDRATQSYIDNRLGESAHTEYQVVEYYTDSAGKWFSLVSCDIHTGRTHQIRVHMLHLGHPLVSDDRYLTEKGDPELSLLKDRGICPRLFLHCYRLQFDDTEMGQIPVTCPLPPDLEGCLHQLDAVENNNPPLDDMLFGDTSWRLDLFRPDPSQWRPGRAVQRKVQELLEVNGRSMSLNELNNNKELLQVMMDQGMRGLTKTWVEQFPEVFELSKSAEDGKGAGLFIRMKTGLGRSAEEELEALQAEIADLARRKRKAVSEEAYDKAAQIKKQEEAATRRMKEVMALFEESEARSMEERLRLDPEEARARSKSRPRPVEAFSEDMDNEMLFPSLPMGGPETARPRSRGPAVRSKEPSGPTGLAAFIAAKLPDAPKPAQSTPTKISKEPEVLPPVPDLKEALVEFLRVRPGAAVHINEVNNDKNLRAVMAAQRPKPLQAINKAWLKEHEDTFDLYRGQDNEMYLALPRVKIEKASAKKKQDEGMVPATKKEEKKVPAYEKVIQKRKGEQNLSSSEVSAYRAATQVTAYSYATAGRVDTKQVSESTGVAMWEKKFLGALKALPQQMCSVEALLEAVPSFAESMQVKRAREQQRLLLTFLQARPDAFRCEREREGNSYMVWAKNKLVEPG
eukprot:gnl/MRDRNA2_/MRDRNA2_127064_c0_seq1.p1 gnl/MRDRNA2_/MRDRNA2_127064_c0~~gnl/MRDRNA2_/MRDRNA2_127064_c0_seq1.p1  ORF type:complete len:794 (+),score=166.32 gnl/MRDRNA2_/MRDRNA2_127064_c0_seq1:77-2458(+)